MADKFSLLSKMLNRRQRFSSLTGRLSSWEESFHQTLVAYHLQELYNQTIRLRSKAWMWPKEVPRSTTTHSPVYSRVQMVIFSADKGRLANMTEIQEVMPSRCYANWAQAPRPCYLGFVSTVPQVYIGD